MCGRFTLSYRERERLAAELGVPIEQLPEKDYRPRYNIAPTDPHWIVRLRQAAGETYPSAAVVARYQLLGGTRISAGSDAHQKDAFASGLESGYGVVAAAGFRELAFRRGGERLAVSVPDRFRTRSGPNEAASPSL